MGKFKDKQIEMIETLKNPEGALFGNFSDEEKNLIREYNEDMNVQYKYSGEWYQPWPVLGNAVSLDESIRVRINASA